MPPIGIDRFNIVVADPALEVTGGVIEGYDRDHRPHPTFPPMPVPPVAPGQTEALDAPPTGMPPPDDLFKLGMVRVELDVVDHETGAAEHWTFQQGQDRGETGSWIGQVVVGFYATPRGDERREPFGRIEIVTAGGGHRTVCMHRGPEIRLGP